MAVYKFGRAQAGLTLTMIIFDFGAQDVILSIVTILLIYYI
jgi:hypothetical protein